MLPSRGIGRGALDAISENKMKRIHGLEIPTTLEEYCDPRRAALLVYDMQVGICSQIEGGHRIVERAAAALAAARRVGMRVVFTRHVSMPKSWMGVSQYRTAMSWQRTDDPDEVQPWFLRDTPGAAIVPELAPTPDEAVLDKLSMSAFEGTPLAYALHDCGIRSIVIMGIATEVGIEPTARHASDLGIIPILLGDACGAGHQDAAERSLASLRFAGETVITDVASFVEAVARGRPDQKSLPSTV
jgi:nicotinamidase-related amidase